MTSKYAPAYARRKDGNQAEIEDALTKAGYRFLDLSKAGCGVPDILALSKCGASVFLEIKMPGEKLTEAERRWQQTYTGLCYVIFSAEDALDKLSEIDGRAGR